MDRAQLPLNALRAFEAAARHLNFTRAAIELCVTQGAVSHQVAVLERRLGVPLFRRLPRGLALTDEGLALVPVLADSFDRVGATLDRFAGGRYREVLNLGVVGTFASGWLLERLPDFARSHPEVDLRVMTNNNRTDLAAEGLDLAIRFGDGAWHGTHAEPIMDAPLSPLCVPGVAERLQITRRPCARDALPLLPCWTSGRAGLQRRAFLMFLPARRCSTVRFRWSRRLWRGWVWRSPPAAMFVSELAAERLVRPFAVEIESGRYWLTRLHSRHESAAMTAFREWLTSATRNGRSLAT